MKRNGWKRVALIATIFAAVVGSFTVLESYVDVPWAPRVTLAIAGENKLVRLDSELILLETLRDQAIANGDNARVTRLKLRVVNKQREIKDLEQLMEKHK